MQPRGLIPHAAVAALAFVLGGLLGLLAFPEARHGLVERLLTSGSSASKVGGSFVLVDHTGRPVTERDFRGRFMLVVFGSSRSSDLTPGQLQAVVAALHRVGPDAASVAPVLVTLDPEHDTPPVLAAYVARFDPRLIGLTGTPERIAAAARAFHVPIHSESDPTGAAEPGARRPAPFYLIGPDGRFITHFEPGMGVEALVRALVQARALPMP